LAEPKKAGTVPAEYGKCSSSQVERQEMTMYEDVEFQGKVIAVLRKFTR
jgi:hypothetical protein